jgi:hypothetical protein
MCILCSEEMINKLNITEVRTAGMELIMTSSNSDDAEHISDRIMEIEVEYYHQDTDVTFTTIDGTRYKHTTDEF